MVQYIENTFLVLFLHNIRSVLSILVCLMSNATPNIVFVMLGHSFLPFEFAGFSQTLVAFANQGIDEVFLCDIHPTTC